jgi:hypothetical protein
MALLNIGVMQLPYYFTFYRIVVLANICTDIAMEGTGTQEGGITSSDMMSLPSFVNNCHSAPRFELGMQKSFCMKMIVLRAYLLLESLLKQNIS